MCVAPLNLVSITKPPLLNRVSTAQPRVQCSISCPMLNLVSNAQPRVHCSTSYSLLNLVSTVQPRVSGLWTDTRSSGAHQRRLCDTLKVRQMPFKPGYKPPRLPPFPFTGAVETVVASNPIPADTRRQFGIEPAQPKVTRMWEKRRKGNRFYYANLVTRTTQWERSVQYLPTFRNCSHIALCLFLRL